MGSEESPLSPCALTLVNITQSFTDAGVSAEVSGAFNSLLRAELGINASNVTVYLTRCCPLTVTVSGTCGKAGEKTYTCDVCGATRTEVIPATGAHDFTYQYVDNADGKTHTAFCDCGAKTTENHAYTIYGTVLEQATTRKDGKREMLCICGAKTVIAIPKEDAQLDDVPKTGDITGQVLLCSASAVLLCSASAVLMLVAIVYLLKRKLGNNP